MKSNSLLRKVKQDYAAIAEEFSATRTSPWPEFTPFLKYLKKYSKGNRIKLLDAGCGNGRLSRFLQHEKVDYIGIDNNRHLINIAVKINPPASFLYGDILDLPFPPRSFETVWCIATLHNIPTEKLQLKALRGIKRVLKKDGLFMLTVWNLWQPKYKAYINEKNHEALIPWGQSKIVKRFYHAFKRKELEDLLKKAGFLKLKKVTSKHNFAYICTL